jgi:hypothetical protein
MSERLFQGTPDVNRWSGFPTDSFDQPPYRPSFFYLAAAAISAGISDSYASATLPTLLVKMLMLSMPPGYNGETSDDDLRSYAMISFIRGHVIEHV